MSYIESPGVGQFVELVQAGVFVAKKYHDDMAEIKQTKNQLDFNRAMWADEMKVRNAEVITAEQTVAVRSGEGGWIVPVLAVAVVAVVALWRHR